MLKKICGLYKIVESVENIILYLFYNIFNVENKVDYYPQQKYIHFLLKYKAKIGIIILVIKICLILGGGGTFGK